LSIVPLCGRKHGGPQVGLRGNFGLYLKRQWKKGSWKFNVGLFPLAERIVSGLPINKAEKLIENFLKKKAISGIKGASLITKISLAIGLKFEHR
jgi:hypothetical protein